MPRAKNGNQTNWKWRPKRWWMGLTVFWLISTVGAGIIARSGGSHGAEGAFITIIMLIFAIWAACNDRSWSVFIRIVWVIGVWIIHALLTIPMIFTVGLLAYSTGRPHLVDRVICLFAAFPLVIWAMRRSKFFVEPVVKEDEKQRNLRGG